MTTRDDFTDEEWFRVRSAPWQVAMGLIEAAPTGTFATGRELRAVEEEFLRARDDLKAGDLVRLVANALADDDGDTGTAPVTDDADDDAPLPDRTIAAMGALRVVLDAKVDGSESAAYRTWLAKLAATAASAAKERLIGLTGRKVSPAEQAFLDRLRGALGL